MSLLGLLEDAPDIDIPEVPVWSLPDAPLSPSEAARWDVITQALGVLSMPAEAPAERDDTPIWSRLMHEYAGLFDSAPDDDWIAADFEAAWSMGQNNFLDPENAPPSGYRSPIAERHDRSGMDDATLDRILAGLKRL